MGQYYNGHNFNVSPWHLKVTIYSNLTSFWFFKWDSYPSFCHSENNNQAKKFYDMESSATTKLWTH